MYCGASSGLDILIRKWVPLRDCFPGLHVTLCMNSTWSCHSNRQQYEIVEGCGTLSGLDVLTGIWVPLKENIYKTACISKNNHLTTPLSLHAHIWSWKKSLWMKASLSSWSIHPQAMLNSWIVFQILWPILSTIYHLRFPQTYHHNQLIVVLSVSMSTDFLSVYLPFSRKGSHSNLSTSFWGSKYGGETTCKTYMNYLPPLLCTNTYIHHVHGFPVCITSFFKKGMSLKPKHWLLRKQLWRWRHL